MTLFKGPGDLVVVGNVSDSPSKGSVNGALEAIVISRDGSAANVARAVTVKIDLAPGFQLTLGPLTVGNTDVILHPRKQAVAADLTTAIAGIYERWQVNGKFTVTVASGDADDITRVRVVTEN